MFEIGWSEMLVIAVVLIVVVGPKDLPRMLRTFGKTVAKLRGMAGDFQKQFNEALKEAELDDVKKSIDDIRGLNPMNDIKKSINPFEKAAADVRAGLDKALKPSTPDIASPVAHVAEPLKSGPAVTPAGPEPELASAPPAGLVASAPPEPASTVAHPAAPLKGGSVEGQLPVSASLKAEKPGRGMLAPSAGAPVKTVGDSKAAAKAKPAPSPAKPSATRSVDVKSASVKKASPAAAVAAAAGKGKTSSPTKSAAGNGAKRPGSSK